uniref:Uncharacterized protein n=1 Tax=Trichuris muris TaxID=70415 RepID=A0A5S6QI25_TRIMR
MKLFFLFVAYSFITCTSAKNSCGSTYKEEKAALLKRCESTAEFQEANKLLRNSGKRCAKECKKWMSELLVYKITSSMCVISCCEARLQKAKRMFGVDHAE